MNAKVEDVDLHAAVEAGQSSEEGTTIEGESKEVTPEWSEAEALEAEAMGWIPPERAGKLPEGKKFVAPKEYMERNPLYTKMKNLESTMESLNSHHQRVLENDRKKAEKKYQEDITQLKAEKVEAIKEGDGERVVQIEDAIEQTEKPESATDPIFDTWVKNNDWYTKDSFLSVEADMVAEKYLAKGLRGRELLDAMTTHVKSLHKDKFEPESRARPAAVEGDTRGAKRSTNKSYTEKDLLPDEREVFKNFERMNIFGDEKAKTAYFKDVIGLRE
jgi:hypothetical protein